QFAISIPSNVLIFLLTLAIIDDIVAVLIIALFYSCDLAYSGFAIAVLGLLLLLVFKFLSIATAYAYILTVAILWLGLLKTGAHPTLAGVVLGLMTPVTPIRMRERERPLDMLARIAGELTGRASSAGKDVEHMSAHLRELRLAQRELLPPVVRMQAALHPWVAFGIMPLFALANAGISLDGIDLALDGAQWVTAGILIALVIGKPLGIVGASWLMVRLGCSSLPAGVSWGGIWLVGLFA